MNELHYHLDGGLRLSTILDLYEKTYYYNNKKPSPFVSLDQLKKELIITSPVESLDACLKPFEITLAVLQTAYGLERAAYEAVLDLSADGVDYAEIRFAPASHLQLGLNQRQAIDAVISGISRGVSELKKAEKEIKVGLILCMMRGYPSDVNMETVALAHIFSGTIVCGIDIAGDEEKYPLYEYIDEFKYAASLRVPFTIHCGEVDSKLNMLLAIDLGAKRIGHGTNAIYYPDVIDALKAKDILVECCVSSNFLTGAVKNKLQHPIKALYKAGVKVIPCADDTTIFNTTTSKEILYIRNNMDMTYDELSQMQDWGDEARLLK